MTGYKQHPRNSTLPPLRILLSLNQHAAVRAEANRKPASGFTVSRAFFCADSESIANI